MKKWVWLSLLGMLMLAVLILVYPLRENKVTPPAPAAGDESAVAGDIALSSNFSNDGRPIVASRGDKPLPGLPRDVENVPLPKVFWGYLRLVETTFFGHNHHLNRAVLEDLVTSKKAVYSLNAVLPYGSKLTQILTDRIVVEKNGARRTLKLFTGMDNPDRRNALLMRGYQRVAQNEWLIRPNRLLQDNQKVESILNEAKISLYRNEDGVQGLQVNNLRQGGLIEEMGVQGGDVIRAVNGEEISDLGGALSAYAKIKQSPLVNVRVKRNQRTVNLSYWIIPDGAPAYSIKDILQLPKYAKLFMGGGNKQ